MSHSWFREDLPEGALEFNEGLVEEQAADPPRWGRERGAGLAGGGAGG